MHPEAKRLAACKPRPRSLGHRPGYPSACAASALILCSCATAPVVVESPAVVAIHAAGPVPVATTTPAPPEPPPPPRPGADLTPELIASLKFHEDTDPAPMIGCGGSCPAPYVLETNAMDERQVKARIKWCAERYERQVRRGHGTLSVSASIDVNGVAKSIKVKAGPGVPEDVPVCIHLLLEATKFSSSYNFARKTETSVRLPLES